MQLVVFCSHKTTNESQTVDNVVTVKVRKWVEVKQLFLSEGCVSEVVRYHDISQSCTNKKIDIPEQ